MVAGFRAAKHLGVSFGVLPFTNVGYNYTSTEKVGDVFPDQTHITTFKGEGGLHQAYVGVGWSPFKNLALGANVSYLWGDYTKTVEGASTVSGAKTDSRVYSTDVNSYKIDFGVQYTLKIAKRDNLTIGATFTPGHGLGASANMLQYSTDGLTGVADTTSFRIDKAFKLPNMYGVGLMWNHADQWKVGFDYTLQQWGNTDYPAVYKRVDGNSDTYNVDGAYADRSKFNLGMQYCYGEYNRHFFKRLRYRAGVSYATSYYKVNGIDGPKEISVSAGFGIPIMNNYNHRSFLNISGQWVKSSAKDLIKENTFRLNIGFTFNEEWFRKWRMK